jgi:hypothetical protein
VFKNTKNHKPNAKSVGMLWEFNPCTLPSASFYFPYILRILDCFVLLPAEGRKRAGFACTAEGRLKRTMSAHGLAYSLHKFGGVNKILHTWHIGIQNALSVSFPSGFSLADKEYFVGGF